MTTQEQENEYLKAYFDAWKDTEEYQGMTKAQVKKHLDQELQNFRLIMAGLWGHVECARKLGHDNIRLENILTGNNTRH